MTLEQRLNRLERQNRRLKGLGLLLVAVFAAVVCMGQLAEPETVRAKRFELLDAAGITRGELYADKAHTILSLTGPAVKDRPASPSLSLGLGTDRVELRLYSLLRSSLQLEARDGHEFIEMLDTSGHPRVRLVTQPGKEATLEFLNAQGKVLWQAPPD